MAALDDIAKIGTTPRLVRAAARAFGSLAAIEEDGNVLSFADLEREMMRAARAFLAAGVEHGDRVAIWAPNVGEWILAALGLQAAGAILVPLNTRYKGAEAAYILNKSRARVLCTVGEFLGTDYAALARAQEIPHVERIVALRGASPGAQPWSEFLAAGEAIPEPTARARADAVAPDDLADIMFTSGTTGKPKGVMTAHGQNLRVFEVWSRVVTLREGDRYLVINPFFHSFGYKAGFLSAFMRGVTVLPHLVFDVKEVLERVSKDRISVLPAPPTIYQSILAFPDREKYDISNLRLAVTGAAAVPVELVHRMRDVLGFETIVTAYGLTESTGTVSICQPDDDAETIANTSGCAIPDIEVRCVDSSGNEVPRGTPGEVVVRGYNVMKGYFEDEAATRATIDADGWLHTGDIAVMDERGYLRITDRIKDMFIMGGFNCYPAEIESLIFEMPGVAQVAVIGVPDERMGEVGMAFVVPAAGAALTPEKVIAWSREHMANFKVPRFVRLIDALPVNASGKVTKNELRDLAKKEGIGA